MSVSPMTQRGAILLQQRRYSEAEKYFREALAIEPEDSSALYRLAVCELHQKRSKDALATVDRALALNPNSADFHSLRSIILIDLRRLKEAQASSDEAIGLDPDSDFAFTSRASVFLARNEWAKAEQAARQALEINPENANAATQLAHALRLQNRIEESGEQTQYMLSQDPESSSNHNAAGWLALQRGQPRQAEEHFLEALRLEAGNTSAQSGLKEAFKARSTFYRGYLQYCFFMQRFTAGKQWIFVVGLLLGFRALASVLSPALAGLVLLLYLLFVLWSHLARGVGNFQLLCDRSARYSLNRGEKWEAWFVGAGVISGLPLTLIGLATGLPVLFIAGLTLAAAALPFAHTFTNASPAGRWVFGGLGALVYLAGAANFLSLLMNHAAPYQSIASLGITGAVIALIGSTWLSMVRPLNCRN